MLPNNGLIAEYTLSIISYKNYDQDTGARENDQILR